MTLIRHIFRIARRARPYAAVLLAGTVLGGPALAQTGAPLSPSVAADFEVRITRLQAELQELTGKYEEAMYANSQLKDRLDRLQSDLDVRLSQIENKLTAAPAAGATSADTGETAPPPAKTGKGMTAAPAKTAGGEKDGGKDAGKETKAAATLPAGSAQDQYNYAFEFLRQADYDKAEVALTQFLAKNGKDPLAANAQYWLAETYYVRAKFKDAAVAFAESYKKFPKGPKAPDSLLKLGMSLGSLNQKSDACTTLKLLEKDFPDASAAIKRRSEGERSKLGCS